MNQSSLIARPSDTQMLVNIPFNDMTLPLSGPQNPLNPNTQIHYNQNTLAGHVEELIMDDTSFKAQHLTHDILGYAVNPSEYAHGEFIGDIAKALANDGRTVDLVKTAKTERKVLKRKRNDKGDLSIVEGQGAYQGPWAKWQGDGEPAPVPEGYVSEPSPEPEAEAAAASAAAATARKKKARAGLGTESTLFHGKSERDYQGRTYMYPPYGVAPQLHQEAGTQESFIPKVCIHTWTGHTGGIAAIRLFPGTSHLLLSASMDTKIKVRIDLPFSLQLISSSPANFSCGTCTTRGTACVPSSGILVHLRISPFHPPAPASSPQDMIGRSNSGIRRRASASSRLAMEKWHMSSSGSPRKTRAARASSWLVWGIKRLSRSVPIKALLS